MSKKPKPIPQFSSEQEERSFWESHDSSEYVDWSKAQSMGSDSLLSHLFAIIVQGLIERNRLA